MLTRGWHELKWLEQVAKIMKKIHLGFSSRRSVHLQWYFFLRYCTFFSHQIFPDSAPKIRKYLPPRIWCCATPKHKWYCCHMTSFCLVSLVVTVGDVTPISGSFILKLWPKSLKQLWCEVLNFLGSKVYSCCNLKSLSIKDSAQMRMLREQLPNIFLTFAKKPWHKCSSPLTRIWRFFQNHNAQKSSYIAYTLPEKWTHQSW